MAYVREDEEENAQGYRDDGLGVFGGFGGGAPAPAPTPASSSPTPQSTSTDHVSWDRILSANKDSAKAASDKLAAGVEKRAQDVQGQVGQARATFGGEVLEGTPDGARPTGTGLDEKPAAPTNVFGQPTRTPQVQPSPLAPPVVTDAPAGLRVTQSGGRGALSPEQAKARAAQKYTGPGALSEDAGWGDILRAGGEASRRVGLTQSRDGRGQLQGDSGIEALLREQTPGGYTPGQSRQDAALLGATGRGRFNDLQQKYGGIMGELGAADDASKRMSEDARTRTAADATDAQRALDTYQKPLDEAKARLAREQADDALYRKGFVSFRNIQDTTHPGTRQLLIDKFNREFGEGAFEAASRAEQAQVAKGAPKNNDGTTSVNWKFG